LGQISTHFETRVEGFTSQVLDLRFPDQARVGQAFLAGSDGLIERSIPRAHCLKFERNRTGQEERCLAHTWFVDSGSLILSG
jgi:hypothetical protein